MTRELHRLNRSERIQVRFRRGELEIIEAVAKAQGVPRSEWVRVTLAAAVAQITSPPTENMSAQSPQRTRRSNGDGRPRHRAANKS